MTIWFLSMNDNRRNKIDIPHALVAFGVGLTAFVVYTLTKAPTVSFWDCGEFIAASAILGVPHPPGTPLYILIGRLFCLLPLSSDVGVRVNMLSVFCSSLAALFGYLIAVRILRLWFGSDRSAFTRLLIYTGSAAGALFLAFGFTNWNNSVEAEVYGMTIMLMTATVWLTLIAMEKKGTPAADRILLLIVYLGFLGIGVHMSTFLVIPIAALFFIFKNMSDAKAWFATAIFFALELYLIFAMSSQPGEVPYYVPVAVVFLFYLFYIFSFERIPSRYILVGAAFMAAMAPLYATVLRSLGRTATGTAAGNGVARVLGSVGKSVFVALILFALYSLFKYFSRKKESGDSAHYLTSSVFILAAALLSAILYLPKGYTPFLITSAMVLIVLIAVLWRELNWTILLAIVGISLVVLGVKQLFYGIVVSAAAVVVLGLILKVPRWRTALMIIICAVAGFSVHLFIPIRSAQQPMINENNPSSSLAATINYLERKQYGSQSMVERMFKRRGEWENQFGNYERMGYWRFFHQQYGLSGPKFVVLFLLGVFGIWEVTRRRFNVGLPFLLLLLISSVGLVLYMNFADGTRQHPLSGADYMEVRDRDYFFTPAFIFFGLAIGIGIAIVVHYIRQAVSKFSSVPKKIIVTASLVLFLLPSLALARNYYYCDRSRNYVPYDYAWNLLTSADQDAVLFTYGDNDTFPLWCLQEAYGVRRDVKIVNLSLANTTWYIKQLKHNMYLELGWTDEQIDQLRPYRTADGTAFQLRDQVIDAIIANNLGRIPVNFSVTVSTGARRFQGRPIDTLLELSGMMWRVDSAGSPLRVDIESSVDYFTNSRKFRARGVNDTSFYKDENTLRLTENWANGFLVVADSLRRAGDLEGAQRLVKQAVEQIPHSLDAVEFLANLYSDQKRDDELRALIEQSMVRDKRKLNFLLGRVERELHRNDEAERVFSSILDTDPAYRPAFQELLRLYAETNQITRIRTLLQRWLLFNPGDKQAENVLEQIQRGYDTADTVGLNNP